ncbi:hypothetical protein [uncultured Thalassospira sp.]|uniref:hypothetical protein n=1 Tax=uncultured Thalassospira sp. TaxID=404382 RepID=UPI0025848B41|nr:hypothetical protein [uncultured Thalassospira sp.]
MRVVKALVVFMGVLIVIGIGLVAYGLSLDKNAKEVDSTDTGQAPSVPIAGLDNGQQVATGFSGAPVIPDFGDITIDIAPGEVLVAYSVQGTQAILHIEGPDGLGARLVIVSLTDKKVLGRIILNADGQ